MTCTCHHCFLSPENIQTRIEGALRLPEGQVKNRFDINGIYDDLSALVGLDGYADMESETFFECIRRHIVG
jgi:hypothetical protein